jgi:hypothetical protein
MRSGSAVRLPRRIRFGLKMKSQSPIQTEVFRLIVMRAFVVALTGACVVLSEKKTAAELLRRGLSFDAAKLSVSIIVPVREMVWKLISSQRSLRP